MNEVNNWMVEAVWVECTYNELNAYVLLLS